MKRYDPEALKGLIAVVSKLTQRGFTEEQIWEILQALAEAADEHKEAELVKKTWEAPKSEVNHNKIRSKWIKAIVSRKIRTRTMRRLMELDNQLKINKMMGVKEVSEALGVSPSHAVELMHRAAAKLPHIKEYREGKKLFIVREEK